MCSRGAVIALSRGTGPNVIDDEGRPFEYYVAFCFRFLLVRFGL